MKYFFTFLLLTCSFRFSYAQENVLNKRIAGVQMGFLGIWSYGEFNIGEEVNLRFEAGLDLGIRSGILIDKTTFVLATSLTIAPRWYYNLENRNERGRNTNRNSGNFSTFQLRYQPAWFEITDRKGALSDKGLIIMPIWGIRRQFSRKSYLSYEAGLGVGYEWRKNKVSRQKTSNATIGIHLRFGI